MKVRHRGRTVLAAAVLASLLTPAAAAPAAAAAKATVAKATVAKAKAKVKAKVTVVTGSAKTGSTPLNMRRSPSPSAERVGSVANGKTVWILCQVAAQQVTGTVRTTNLWDHLANGSYVSDAYVVRPSTGIPRCAPAKTPAEAPAERAPAIPKKTKGESWRLPIGASMVSGFRTTARPSHDGVDLSAARNTPIVAAAAGTVIRVVCNVSAGSCDVDGNRTLSGCGWYAEVQHAGGVVTRYCHMIRRPAVTVGQPVKKGQLLGYVGTSGSSSGPHLHFEVHVNAAPATHANAVDPIAFYRSRGVTLG
ncbi:peptidoglycan DD-metalloendopeptidase family protein [Actinoplanes sp. NPDC023936]|uniref:peptidoglycan DD-metalloendopeptidase family protein n=1 Tax=Actinoplanes sp. NPDC023936 TaxID=3154910 RepID=UPI0033EC098C